MLLDWGLYKREDTLTGLGFSVLGCLYLGSLALVAIVENYKTICVFAS
jgi:hypothetical protein